MLNHVCNKCRQSLSDMAEACPKCGAPKPTQGWEKFGPIAQSFSFALKWTILFMIAWFLYEVYRRFTGN